MPTYAYEISVDGRHIRTVYTETQAEGMCKAMLGSTFVKRSLLRSHPQGGEA